MLSTVRARALIGQSEARREASQVALDVRCACDNVRRIKHNGVGYSLIVDIIPDRPWWWDLGISTWIVVRAADRAANGRAVIKVKGERAAVFFWRLVLGAMLFWWVWPSQ